MRQPGFCRVFVCMRVAKKARKGRELCRICEQHKPVAELTAPIKAGYAVCKECKSHLNRMVRFNLSPQDFDKLLEIQNNRCAICESELLLEKNHTVIDHCHETNRIRGILCRNCNTGLGVFRDSNANLANAAKYLINPPAVGVVTPVDTNKRWEYIREYNKKKPPGISTEGKPQEER